MTVSEPITVFVFGRNLADQIAFIKKNFFRFEPVTLPSPLVVNVCVDGTQHKVRVINNREMKPGERGIVVNVPHSGMSSWALNLISDNLVRLLIGGAEPKIERPGYSNTTWMAELEPNWLENLVRKLLALLASEEIEATIYKKRDEKFSGYIAYTKEYIRNHPIQRPATLNDPTVQSIFAKNDSTLYEMNTYRGNPLFRREWKKAFGLDSAYHLENDHFITLDRNDCFMHVYFTEKK